MRLLLVSLQKILSYVGLICGSILLDVAIVNASLNEKMSKTIEIKTRTKYLFRVWRENLESTARDQQPADGSHSC